MSRPLDEAVAIEQAHKEKQKELRQGRRVKFADPEPWPRSVDGAAVAAAVSSAISYYVAAPTTAADTFALWALHTHMVEAFDISPRLAVVSVTKGCGKTLLFRVLAALVRRPKTTGSVSPASLFRAVEKHAPTFLIDEAGKFLQPNSEFHGLITQGYGKGFTVMRTLGDSHELVEFNVYSAVALAKIGRFPSDIEDRSIVVTLQRKLRTEITHSFSHGRHPEVDKLKRMVVRWCADSSEAVAAADPDMGDLFNRVADVWRPLYQIADVLGGDWPKRVRDAAAALVLQDDDAEEELIRLLADIRSIFDAEKTDWLSSAVLTNALVELEGRGWAEYGKAEKPLTQNRLASAAAATHDRPKGRARRRKGAQGLSARSVRRSLAALLVRLRGSTTATPQQAYCRKHFYRSSTATSGASVAVEKYEPNPWGQAIVAVLRLLRGEAGVTVAHPPTGTSITAPTVR